MGTGEGSEDVGDILSAILACTPTSFPLMSSVVKESSLYT